jgi:cobalt/nickel transport system permease protein
MNTRRLWIILVALAVLAPLGLWVPARLGAGGAWGEWSPDDLGEQVGFVPRGLARIADLWKAPVPDYAPPGWEGKSLAHQSAAYIASALFGLCITAALIYALGRWLARRGNAHAP